MEGSKLVIFDCDGTLTDSKARIVTATQYAFQQANLHVPDDVAIRPLLGLSLPRLMQALSGSDELGLIQKLIDAYRHAVFDLQLSGTQTPPLFKDCKEVLTQLKDEGYALAIATGMGRRGLENLVNEHGIANLFSTLKSADDGPGKPNPDVLLDAMVECGVTDGEAVMVGDTTFDMEAGLNARIPAIGVTWGYHDNVTLTQAGATCLVDSYRELPAVINRLLKDKEN